MKSITVASIARGLLFPLEVRIFDTSPGSNPGIPVAIVKLNADGSFEGDVDGFLAATKDLGEREGGPAEAERLVIWTVANAIGRDRRS
jgi:hypothetical protein